MILFVLIYLSPLLEYKHHGGWRFFSILCSQILLGVQQAFNSLFVVVQINELKGL